ncbi:MAG: permease [Thermodesulfobacteriota bacterium]
MQFFSAFFAAAFHLLQESALYILFGLLVGGLLKVFLSPSYVARHLGRGRFLSVYKAALFGIPIPLCSCGVLPAAAALKRQGANKGATMAFLISTPESGVDSISITYALLDPLMTVARPVAAFFSAMAAGISQNLMEKPAPPGLVMADLGSQGAAEPAEPSGLLARVQSGARYAVVDIWGDLAGWFYVGVGLAALITVLVPDVWISRYLGGGISAMLLMLLFGIPLYICATASTPIAAALILKGVSPGAALVFLLVGPATNMASLSVLVGMLGKRSTALYLLTIAVMSVVAGLLLDWLYGWLAIEVRAVTGQAGEVFPPGVEMGALVILLLISIRPLLEILRGRGGCH